MINRIETLQKHLRTADFRIGVQKTGELSNLSTAHISWAFDAPCPAYDTIAREYFQSFETNMGTVGIVFVRNEDLGPMVGEGLVDAAIIGSDIFREQNLCEHLSTIRRLSDGKWPFVFAYPEDRKISPTDAHVVATSYPNITRELLTAQGNTHLSIIRAKGSVEIFPYLTLPNGTGIDAVTDISVTGKTLQAHGLEVWSPELTLFYPLLIGNPIAMETVTKRPFFEHL